MADLGAGQVGHHAVKRVEVEILFAQGFVTTQLLPMKEDHAKGSL